MQSTLDDATGPWGVKVERVEMFVVSKYWNSFSKLFVIMIYIFFNRKDVSLPVQLQKAMAAEAEASREARAKVIAAEGEMKASRALKEASEVMVDNPIALQVRV